VASTISPAVRAKVIARDHYRCIAPSIDGHAGLCRDTWGNPIVHWPPRDRGPQYLTMSHTKNTGEMMMGKKAPSTERHLVTLCPFHHQGTTAGSNWEAVNREKIRRRLDELYSDVRTYR
jgi:hypothetical protein